MTTLDEQRQLLAEIEQEIANTTAEAERRGRVEADLKSTKREVKAGRTHIELGPDGELETHPVVVPPLPPAVVLEFVGEGVRLVPQKGRELRPIGEDQQRFEDALRLYRAHGAQSAAARLNMEVPELMHMLDRGIAEWGGDELPWPSCDPERAGKLRQVYEAAQAEGIEKLAQRYQRPVDDVLGLLHEGARHGLFVWPPPTRDAGGDLVGATR